MNTRHGRLQWWRPDELDGDQREVYDAIAGGPRAEGPQHFALVDDIGRLHGPFNAMLAAPAVGAALQQLGAAIRYQTCLSDRVRESAILQVAAHHRSAFEWHAHERIGRAQGLSDGEISVLGTGDIPETFTPLERAAAAVVHALLASRDLDDECFAAARDHLDERALMELITLVGYYELLSLQLTVWRTPLPNGAASRW